MMLMLSKTKKEVRWNIAIAEYFFQKFKKKLSNFNFFFSITDNKDAVIVRSAPNKANITWRPSQKDQSQLGKQGITGKFVVQYDIKRELDAGEVLVIYN